MALTTGRYQDITRAPTPGELPREGKVHTHCQIRHGVVADPNPSLRGRRQKVAINVKTDALEREYANGRITGAAYLAARIYKHVLEKSRRPISASGAWNPGNRVDQVLSHELSVLTRVAAAQDAVGMVRDTAPTVGMIGQRVLELTLVDELTLTDVAKRISGNAERQHVIYYAQVFRDSCEGLADHWCRRANRAPRT